MTAPAGAGGAAGAPAAPVPPVDTDPRRARPEGTPMTLFLIEIGRQHRPRTQRPARTYEVNSAQHVAEALRLGDIRQVGTTPIIPAHPAESDSETEDNEGEDESGAGAKVKTVEMVPESGGYPIYEFFGPETGTFGEVLLKFSADPRYGDIVGPSYPPNIPHHPGEIHSDMEAALWGGYCYAHPRPVDRHADYADLLRGMHLRYGGNNQPPR